MEKDKLAKVVVDLKARLKESESRMEDSELWASKEREANQEFEQELLVYKKEVVEQHEKGLHKAVRQAGFFVKDLVLALFNPFQHVNDGVLLIKEDITAEEETSKEQDVGANVQADVQFLLCWILATMAM